MRLLAVVLLAGAGLAQTPPVQCGGKLSESQVEKLLSAGVSQTRVEQFVRTCGIGFEVTSSAAGRLRRAGASGALIDVLREIQPKRPDPVAKKDTPPARKETPTRVNPKDGLTYVWIPPGKFLMGCSPRDSECYDDEKPAHRVTITKGFWIGQTEVTQAAYERVIGNNPSHFKGASLPVETITWDEATAYCKAVEMRLPTEAEWEYAARGGNPAGRYGPVGAVAWYSSNSGRTTHEVAQKQPNGYGLYDILGNVWEWAADWFDETYYPSSPLNDPQGPSDGTHRTLRGGSWSSSASSARASYRIGYTGRIRRGTLGKIFGPFGPTPNLNTIGVRCAGE